MCCVSQKKPPRPLAAQGPRPPRGGRFLPWGDPAAKKTHVRTCIHTVSGGIDSKNADRKSTRLNSSHLVISYAVFCLKKKTTVRPRHGRHDDSTRGRSGSPGGDRARSSQPL